MKRLIVCLMAMMGVLTLSAQSSMELHQVPRQSRWSCVETL